MYKQKIENIHICLFFSMDILKYDKINIWQCKFFSTFSKTFYVRLDLTNKEFSNGFYGLFHIVIKLNNFLSELQNIPDTFEIYCFIFYLEV